MARRSFLSDRNGNVGIILALAIVPLVGIAGLAMDYARALNEQARVQTMTDSTALAMAHQSPTLSRAEVETKARAYFTAGMPDFVPRGSDWLELDRNKDQLSLQVRGGVDTVLLRVLGIRNIDIDTSSQISWGLSKVEIALVLDTTGSMAGEKIRQLRTAATNFVNTLEQVNRDGSVKIGLVPYALLVRVDDATFRDADWLDTSEGRKYRFAEAVDKEKWRGCLGNRAEPHDISDSVSVGPRQPAVVCQNNVTTIMPLSENFSGLRTRISALGASGYTNIPLGMVWGMSLLSGNGPFKQAAAPNDKLEKVIVLLTDGDNTRTIDSGDVSRMNARLTSLCNEAHARKYTVYSIRVMDGNAALLRSCAARKGVRSEANYFNVETAAELIPVFQRIANELSDLRISK